MLGVNVADQGAALAEGAASAAVLALAGVEQSPDHPGACSCLTQYPGAETDTGSL